MKKIFLILFLCTLLTQLSIAQLSSVKPDMEGFSSQRLNRIDNQINQWIKEEQLNGASAIILRNGKIVYHKSFGFSNKEQNISMRNDNIFRIASMTKPIISVAAMMLFETGSSSKISVLL